MDTTPISTVNETQAIPAEFAYELDAVERQFRIEGHVIPVLKGISLNVRFGEWIALVGPSGCGKTTLLHILGALDRPSSGTLRCHGRVLNGFLSGPRGAALRRNQIGMVFQVYHLLPECTAIENVVLPALRRGVNKQVFRRRGVELLESFGLGNRLNHRPQELSGGEQQRVAVARALINDPAILLADEPTGNLDAASSDHIIDIFRALHRDQQKTIVMVTHDPELARQADRVIRLADGHAMPESPAPPAAGSA